ncbi:MAG: hypothetical protein NDI61_01755 [Bdellovibrionaceae bacterium]|nr:hypothetical protein [Pseudobdellovibrionaceae bacterium]
MPTYSTSDHYTRPGPSGTRVLASDFALQVSFGQFQSKTDPFLLRLFIDHGRDANGFGDREFS